MWVQHPTLLVHPLEIPGGGGGVAQGASIERQGASIEQNWFPARPRGRLQSEVKTGKEESGQEETTNCGEQG